MSIIIKRSFGTRVAGYLLSKMSRFIKSDEKFIKKYYKIYRGEELDLEHPKTFSQKIQWLKLHNTDPLYSVMVDKYEVRKYVAERVGEKYLIPLLGVWDSFDEIDFSQLPNQFVLKTTHDSGSICICKDKATFDFKKAKKKLSKSLKHNYYWKGREYPYKNATRRIVAEKFMIDDVENDLKDYKIYCFSGQPKYVLVDSERYVNHTRNIYDADWQYQPLMVTFTNKEEMDKRPEKLEEMFEVASKLSKDIPFLRVDLYYVNNEIYFGELTFHPNGGLEEIKPVEWEYKLGAEIKLPIDE